MFNVTFFTDELITVIHLGEKKVTKKLLDHPNATFVWGELMNPHFIGKLLGSPRPYAPAHVRGFTRRPTKEFFNVARNPGGVAPGVLLLGLSNADVKKLNAFEQLGVKMERREIDVFIGQRKRTAFIYLKKPAD